MGDGFGDHGWWKNRHSISWRRKLLLRKIGNTQMGGNVRNVIISDDFLLWPDAKY